jgi:hypothetical protein
MQTNHPHAQSFNSTILMDVIQYCRNYASTYAEDEAKLIQPEIMPWTKWTEHWDFAWKSAMDYATEGLTVQQLYPSKVI